MGKQNSKLKPVILEDLAANTQFTERELQDWYSGMTRDTQTGQADPVSLIRVTKLD